MTGLDVNSPGDRRPAWRPAPVGERIISRDQLAARMGGGPLPRDVILVPGPDGTSPVAICCPITGVPLTERMAAASGTSRAQLAAMVSRAAPLGVPTGRAWRAIQSELAAGLPLITGTGADPAVLRTLGEGAITAVAAGSAVGGFHSTRTTAERGTFPATEAELEARLRAKPAAAGGEGRREATIGTALRRYRALGLGDRVPTAPWFSVFAHLGLEAPSDCDIRISSAVVDQVMQERAAVDPAIRAWTDADRLLRWNRADVNAAFPGLRELAGRLEAHGAVSISFLSPGGAAMIPTRSDWWPIPMAPQHR